MSFKLWKLPAISLLVLIALFATKLSSPFGYFFYISLNLIVLLLIYLLAFSTWRIWLKINWRRYLFIPIGIIALTIFLILFITWIDYRYLIPSSRISQLSESEWQADFNFIESELAKHPKADSALIASIHEINGNDPNTNQNLVRFMQKVALFRDGHSMVHPFQFYSASRFFPLRGYYFSDGYYITDASDEYMELKYSKLIRINEMDFDSIFNRLKTVIGADNLSQYKSMLDIYLFSATVLNGLSITESDQKAVFQFEQETGQIVSKEIESESFLNWMFWSLKPINHFSPVYFNRRTKNYSIRSKGADLILDFNLIENQSDDYTIKDLAKELSKTFNEKNIKRFIIDLRTNSGGNNYLYKPIIELIKANPAINKKSNLFALISRRTFSAAINFVDELQAETNITLVGEAPGAGASHYGDARYLNLPNSKFGLLISTKQWLAKDSLNGSWDIEPDIIVDYRFDHFKDNKDPWLARISIE